jgi:trans-aconitate methyltransferase
VTHDTTTDTLTRELIARRAVITPVHAVDLGCGSGRSTRLLHGLTSARRTTGCDTSPRCVAEARRTRLPGLAYVRHDVTRAPFPGEAPDLLLCRHLLADLAQPERVLETWAHAARPGACLLIHETGPVGAQLNRLLGQTRWTLVESRTRRVARQIVAVRR